MNPDDPDVEPARVPGLEGLSMEREPAADLWPGIEARLAPKRRMSRPYAMAAALVAGVGTLIGAAVLQEPVMRPAGDSAPVPVATTPAQPADLAGLPARHDHSADAVAMRTLVKANLKIVTDGEKQLKRAIADHPDADYLQQLLVANREQQRVLRDRLSQATT